jgi:hypothetical protein
MYKVWKKKEIISSKDLSKSSKLLLFISLQIVQKRQVGTIFHPAVLLGLPVDHQHANKWITHLGITQDIPKQKPHHNEEENSPQIPHLSYTCNIYL